MSKIEWTGQTWNPIVGCSVVSPGCTNCYAMRMAARLEAMNEGHELAGNPSKTLPHYDGLTRPSKAGPVWTGKVALAGERNLLAPLRRRVPTTYFVNSMGDLFHEDVPDAWIDRVFAVMGRCKNRHTFQVLTKRSSRMRAYMTELRDSGRWMAWKWEDGGYIWDAAVAQFDRVFEHIWLGVSAEDQRRADERVPDLLATPAAVLFVSAEPLLGPIDFEAIRCQTECKPPDYCNRCYPDGGTATGRFDALQRGIDWVIVGGESGPSARPMHPEWARDIRDQCHLAGIAFFFKQWGAWAPGECIDGPQTKVEDGATLCDGQWVFSREGLDGHIDDEADVLRVGKARSGRLLDGRTWDEMPGASKYDQALTDPHHGGKVAP